ncbi:MAG: hypothetical protein CENE_02998 [Candidatus Celerinatantimonas neptuna]|nr:MAG: hypothetical protein CENE_02998 [Candidatus Celerinatantimonas neptuna]
MKIMRFCNFSLCLLLMLPFTSHASVEASLGLVGAHLSYRETGVHQSGYLTGLKGHLAVHQGLMVRFDGSYISGHVDYNSTDTGSMKNMSDYIYEIRGLIGQDLYTPGLRITPYTGLGYRNLKNNSAYRRSTTGALGYNREQSYIYLPVGLMFQQMAILPGHWGVGFKLEFDQLIRGYNTSELGTIPGKRDLSFHQKTGSGAQASITFKRYLDSDFFIRAITFTPYVKYWDVNASNVNEGYYEPDNTTVEFGATLSASI